MIPRSVVVSSTNFLRAARGINPPNGVRVHVSGIDLVRDSLGGWRVLEDNVRVPSGVSYVLSNRRAMAQTFPELFAALRIRPVADYPRRLLAALTRGGAVRRRRADGRRADARASSTAPTTSTRCWPGRWASSWSRAATCSAPAGASGCARRRAGAGSTSSTGGSTTTSSTRSSFRNDSYLGSPGLMTCARNGTVTIANAVGNGVADDKLVYTYVPDLIRYYLSEQPILRNVDTWRLEEPDALEEVLDRLDELVVKPVDGSGGKGLVVGPKASRGRAGDAARSGSGTTRAGGSRSRSCSSRPCRRSSRTACGRGTPTCARSR